MSLIIERLYQESLRQRCGNEAQRIETSIQSNLVSQSLTLMNEEDIPGASNKEHRSYQCSHSEGLNTNPWGAPEVPDHETFEEMV